MSKKRVLLLWSGNSAVRHLDPLAPHRERAVLIDVPSLGPPATPAMKGQRS